MQTYGKALSSLFMRLC